MPAGTSSGRRRPSASTSTSGSRSCSPGCVRRAGTVRAGAIPVERAAGLRRAGTSRAAPSRLCRAAARDAAWKAGPVPTVTTRPWIWMPRSCAPRPAKKMRRRRTSAPTGTIRSPRCWQRPARSWPGCSGQATPEWSSSRLSRRYSLAASARSSTWPMSGLQGNRISSSQPASVKALMVSVTCVGVVSAPATICWAKSPRNP
jgi:hypothetical protein